MERRLSDLLPESSGFVKTVGAANPNTKRRLIDMGITPMTEIYIKKIAPLGDPIEISLRGYSMSIRKEDAEQITLLSQEELDDLRAREAEHDEFFDAYAHKRLGDHPKLDSDREAHQRAAKLSNWFITNVSSMCPAGGCKECMRDCAAKQGKNAIPEGSGTPVKLGLVGNPNAGKTTLFNAITGAKEYVGNWPGVTVEKKERRFSAFGHEITIVDLPGIYSLSTYSMEELVARNFVIDEKPDAIINIVDATNLERNLYLTVQLMELERPMIIALNMMDEVEKQGIEIDCGKLSLELGIPVVPICARTGQGVDTLLSLTTRLFGLVHEQLHAGFGIEPDHLYDDHTHAIHHRIGEIIAGAPEKAGLPAHWAEIKLLEGDQVVRKQLQLTPEQEKDLDRAIAAYSGDGSILDGETRIADARYSYITRICKASVKRRKPGEKSVSDRIDSVLTNKYLGIPIFLLIMGAIFILTFDTVGTWLSDGVDTLVNGLFVDWVRGLLSGTAPWLTSLICDGIITGVGGVLTFLPQIALLFFFLSLLEESGYMYRTAFLMDRALKRFGLSGKSFIPMLMGFGCTVPAVMAARTMENMEDRRMTIMLVPFVSCSAKLPVYGLIASVFFEQYRGLVVLSLYVLGILVGIATGILFRKTIFKANHAPFVMELPPYRVPAMKNTLTHVGERVQHFLEKAGTIILVMSIVLWFFTYFTPGLAYTEEASASMLGKMGSFIAPLFTPLGFGRWEPTVALLTGLIAKEAVVSSLSLFVGATGDSLAAALGSVFTPLAAYAYLVFVLLYVPCMAATATIHRELGKLRYTLFIVAYQIGIAYLVSFLVYSLGMLIF